MTTDKAVMRAALKPCPFCGGRMEFKRGSQHDASMDFYEHPNNDCALANVDLGDTITVGDYTEAIAAWNRRAALAAPVEQGDYVMVPRVPTDAMILAAQGAWLNDPARRSSTIYNTMLHAAPEVGKRVISDAEIARMFHEAYEELAPSHGYETRPESRKPWADVPANNRSLMIAVVGRVRAIIAKVEGE